MRLKNIFYRFDVFLIVSFSVTFFFSKSQNKLTSPPSDFLEVSTRAKRDMHLHACDDYNNYQDLLKFARPHHHAGRHRAEKFRHQV